MSMWRHLRTIASLATPLGMPVERIEGRLGASGAAVTLLYAGPRETADFIAPSLFDVDSRSAVGRLASPLSLRSSSFRRMCHGVDLVAMDVPRLWQACLPSATQWRMPAWVSQQIVTQRDATITVPRRVAKEARRHARHQGYEVRFLAGNCDLARFYAKMYRPYVEARFGTGAVVVDEARFVADSRKATLALVSADGEWEAGVLLDHRGDTLSLGWFGARTVPPRTGASEVLDVAVLEWAAVRGVTRVVMGHSRPSLANGVVRYKARLGAAVLPTRFPQRTLGLWILRGSPALADAIDAARFVMPSRRGLSTCVVPRDGRAA